VLYITILSPGSLWNGDKPRLFYLVCNVSPLLPLFSPLQQDSTPHMVSQASFLSSAVDTNRQIVQTDLNMDL
jgi:hypothetical protein